MNGFTFYHLRQQVVKYAGTTLGLLGPSAQLCPLCGKTAKSLSHKKLSAQQAPLGSLSPSFAKSLCRNCLADIPWIYKVKCRICGRGAVCPDCIRRSDTAFVLNRSAVQYSEPMRELLAKYKYRGNETLAPYLGEMLLHPLAEMTRELSGRLGIRAGSPWSEIWHAITYVPVSSERAEERGFNQAEKLAVMVSQNTEIPLCHLLVRLRHSEKQSFKTRSARMRDMNSLFAVRAGSMKQFLLMHNRRKECGAPRILLVDDIYTTGSTIQACAEALQKADTSPMDIYALTWARS